MSLLQASSLATALTDLLSDFDDIFLQVSGVDFFEVFVIQPSLPFDDFIYDFPSYVKWPPHAWGMHTVQHAPFSIL